MSSLGLLSPSYQEDMPPTSSIFWFRKIMSLEIFPHLWCLVPTLWEEAASFPLNKASQGCNSGPILMYNGSLAKWLVADNDSGKRLAGGYLKGSW